MPLKSELMAAGMAGGLANQLGVDAPSTTLTATGNSQATALALVSSFSIFTTVAASTGAILPAASGQEDYSIYNGGASPLTVYPAVGQQINGLAANTGLSVPNGKSARFTSGGNQWIGNVSA